MERAPRDPRRGIFTRPVVTLMSIGGVWSGFVNLSVFVVARERGASIEEAMAYTFLTLVLTEFCKAYSYRSDRRSVLDHPFANRWLNLAITWELLLLGVIVYVPFFQDVFGTNSLSATEWLVLFAVAFSVVPVLEIAKAMARRGWFGELD